MQKLQNPKENLIKNTRNYTMTKNVKAFSLGLIILFCAQVIMAQSTISGKIVDEERQPLSGANIVIKNTTIGTASDSEGNYILKGLSNGEYIIRLSFFGYETVEKQVLVNKDNLNLDFVLTQTSIDLNAVVITGTRTEKSLKNTPVVTQSIAIQDLNNRGATNITEALEMQVPGLEFTSQAQGKSISLQGIDPQYMLFLVNGERMAGETYGDIDYSRINMADIQHIEVVKGASSTLYGSSALGGVVNIITKTPDQKIQTYASTRFSKYNTQNYRLSIGSKLGKFSTQTSVNYDNTDGYDLIDGDSFRTQEKEDAVVINEHLKYSFTKDFLLEANASFMNKNRENTSANLYDRRNRDFTYGVKSSWFLNPKDNITLSWNSDKYELFNKVPTQENGGNIDIVSDYKNVYNNARLMGNFNLADWNLLTVGTEYINENMTAPRNDIDNESNTNFVLFAQEDLQLTPDLNLIAGARAHNNTIYNWHFTPQLAAMYKVSNLSFRGSHSLGYKTPTLKEKYMNFQIPAPGPPMFLVGNENLKPETSNYTSLSAEYNYNGISFSVTAYRNKIKDMISENLDTFTVVNPGPNMYIEYQYENLNEVLIQGIDLMLKAKIVNGLLFSGTTTFSRKTNEITGEEFENTRNFMGKYNLDYTFKHKLYRLNTNLQSNFYGGKTINLMDETTHQIEKVSLESFSLWRLTTTQTFKENYFVKLGIDNIFDYTDPNGGYNTGTPGRTFFFGCGINF